MRKITPDRVTHCSSDRGYAASCIRTSGNLPSRHLGELAEGRAEARGNRADRIAPGVFGYECHGAMKAARNGGRDGDGRPR
jgi:hypothetical protein